MGNIFSKKAHWIGCGETEWDHKTDYLSPAVQFRKVFKVNTKEVFTAALRICGVGSYRIFINGMRVGDDVLSPAFTAYDKRALYVDYNVKNLLQKGENIIAVKLGNGFYNQTTKDTWGFYEAAWRADPKFIFELKINEKCVCCSDESWKCTKDGATIHNAVRTGEFFDARKNDGWKELNYHDCTWETAKIVAPVGGVLDKMEMPFIRECESCLAIGKFKSENGWIFDFGVNMSGYVSLKLRGEKGRTIVIRYSELLTDKKIDRSGIDCFISGKAEFATDKYTFSGNGVEEWRPEFVYHGFRYIEVAGLKDEPDISAFTAHFIHTDLEQKGDFYCSNDLLNWIFQAGRRSFLSNFHGFSEDCPQREKNGWTGDAAISCNYAVVLYDMKEAYKKWLTDMKDAQRISGQLPGIIPTSGWGYNGSDGPAWDCALFFLPYELYLETGDKECLELVYETGKKYLQFAENFRKNGLVCFGIPDWCPPEDVGEVKLMPNCLSDSCYYYKMQNIMSVICKLKGLNRSAEKYAEKARKTRESIKEKFIQDGNVADNGQGALAEVLYFHIVEGAQAEKIAKKLAETVEQDGFICKVGILGMKALLNALSEYGYADIVYKLLRRTEYPSYGYWRAQGATTLWEKWRNGRITSLNHHMYGDVVHWLFRNAGGIWNKGIAYNICQLKPFFFEKNCSAKSYTETPYGKIDFSWIKTGNTIVFEIELPKEIQASLVVFGKEWQGIHSGKYKYVEKTLIEI